MPSDTPSNITIGTTNVSLNNIKNAFNGTTTRLSDYYRGGTNIYNITRLNTIPTSGPISFGNFKNTTNVIMKYEVFTSSALSSPFINSRTSNFNLNLSTSNIIKYTILSGVTFSFKSTTAKATVLAQMAKFVPYVNDELLIQTNSNFYNQDIATSIYYWVFDVSSNIPLNTSNNIINIRTSTPASNNIPVHNNGYIEIGIEYIK
jgi:hypothetical protein